MVQLASWNKQLIEEKLAHKDIKWKFNPSAASHFFWCMGTFIQMLQASHVCNSRRQIVNGRNLEYNDVSRRTDFKRSSFNACE